jgi:hypothetical protein
VAAFVFASVAGSARIDVRREPSIRRELAQCGHLDVVLVNRLILKRMALFELVPQLGIGPFHLGLPRAEIRARAAVAGLELQDERGQIDYFGAENSIQVEYDDAGRAWFVGASNSPALFKVIFEGRDLFDTPAKDVFSLFGRRESSTVPLFAKGGHTFPDQVVTLWEAEDQYDHIRRENGQALRLIWAQIGVGNTDYLTATADVG